MSIKNHAYRFDSEVGDRVKKKFEEVVKYGEEKGYKRKPNIGDMIEEIFNEGALDRLDMEKCFKD